MFNGTISVSSEPGVGSTFTFTVETGGHTSEEKHNLYLNQFISVADDHSIASVSSQQMFPETPSEREMNDSINLPNIMMEFTTKNLLNEEDREYIEICENNNHH